MSISASLNNALSGLAASSRAANVVSSNVANAMTDGYGVRALALASAKSGGDGSGVRVQGVVRDSDPILIRQRRDADAAQAQAGNEASFRSKIENIIGIPGDPSSLSSRLSEFEARLVDAANGPHDGIRLRGAVEAAEHLAKGIRDASSQFQMERGRADAAIGAAIAKINGSLAGIVDINEKILATKEGTGDMAALLDEQERLVDEIAPFISINTRRDAKGALQIYSTGGEILVDRRAAVLEFQSTRAVEPGMVVGAPLSGITIRGRDMPFDVAQSPLGGGELEALFAVRDVWGPEAQAQLDAVARDLAQRFDSDLLDPTRGIGQAGLFTDAGVITDPANEIGLAGRLAVNDAVRPAVGGEVWRLRDGLYAAGPGASGDSTYLAAQSDVLSDRRTTLSGAFASGARSMAELMTDHVALAVQRRRSAEMVDANRTAVQSALRQQELARGVDTDAEMQNLLRIETAYAANARVVQAAEAMLDELMRMT